ncbi:hypothetical protein ACGFYM_10355 [Streptomyces sp. NPDC048231]|uniref:hypothetical protein n=1 Tax=Streptomyces sp. NPDC048231 TaxID=3365519 RepID=UPI003711C89B
MQPADLVEPLSAIGEVGLHPGAVTVARGVGGVSLWLDEDRELDREITARQALGVLKDKGVAEVGHESISAVELFTDRPSRLTTIPWVNEVSPRRLFE